MNSKQEKTYKFVLRFPMQLRERIVNAAKHHRRSMNSEIVARLEQSFSAIPDLTADDAIALPTTLQPLFGAARSAEEEQLVLAYRRLPEEKKYALLMLLA